MNQLNLSEGVPIIVFACSSKHMFSKKWFFEKFGFENYFFSKKVGLENIFLSKIWVSKKLLFEQIRFRKNGGELFKKNKNINNKLIFFISL